MILLTGCPVIRVVRWHAHIGDLEPRSRGADGGESVVDLGHVDVDRAEVVSLSQQVLSETSAGRSIGKTYADSLVRARTVVGLLVHLDLDLVAGHDGADTAACMRACIASDVLESQVLEDNHRQECSCSHCWSRPRRGS